MEPYARLRLLLAYATSLSLAACHTPSPTSTVAAAQQTPSPEGIPVYGVQALSDTSEVTTVYGGGIGQLYDFYTGSTEGVLKYPVGIAYTSQGLLVADRDNHRILKVPATDGFATLFAGDGTRGHSDSNWASLAKFDTPAGLEGDSSAVFIADSGNNRIRKYSNGAITTLAGNGSAGFVNGPALQASFSGPRAVCPGRDGVVFVADTNNNCIRRIARDGTVITLAGSQDPGLKNGLGAEARFNAPRGMVRDGSGKIYIADTGNNCIRILTEQGNVTTLAGDGTTGFLDGPATSARFSSPSGLDIDGQGNVYVADTGNNRIRKITREGTVVTVAGTGTAAFADGSGSIAAFNHPQGITVWQNGIVFVSDTDNHRVRRITTSFPMALSAERYAFSPNGDGSLDTNALTIQADEPWVLTASGRPGSPALTVATGTGNQVIPWNGTAKDAQGNTVRLEDWSYELVLKAAGYEKRTSVLVDTQAPQVTNLKLEADAAAQDCSQHILQATISDAGFSGLIPDSVVAGIQDATLSARSFSSATGALSYKVSLSQASVTVTIQAKDNAGNVTNHVSTQPSKGGCLTLNAVAPFSPNGDLVKDKASIHVTGTGTWQLSIADHGALPDGIGSGEQTIAWDGTINGQPLAEGKYTLRLTSGDQVRTTEVIIDKTKPVITKAVVSKIAMDTRPVLNEGELANLKVLYEFEFDAADGTGGSGADLQSARLSHANAKIHDQAILNTDSSTKVVVHFDAANSSALEFTFSVRDNAGNEALASSKFAANVQAVSALPEDAPGFDLQVLADRVNSTDVATLPRTPSAYRTLATTGTSYGLIEFFNDLMHDKTLFDTRGVHYRRAGYDFEYLYVYWVPVISPGHILSSTVLPVDMTGRFDFIDPRGQVPATYSKSFPSNKFFAEVITWDGQDQNNKGHLAPQGAYRVRLTMSGPGLSPAVTNIRGFKVSDMDCIKLSEWTAGPDNLVEMDTPDIAHIFHRHLVWPHNDPSVPYFQPSHDDPKDAFSHWDSGLPIIAPRPKWQGNLKLAGKNGFESKTGWWTQHSDGGRPPSVAYSVTKAMIDPSRNYDFPGIYIAHQNALKVASQLVGNSKSNIKKPKKGTIYWAPVVFGKNRVYWVAVLTFVNGPKGQPLINTFFPYYKASEGGWEDYEARL